MYKYVSVRLEGLWVRQYKNLLEMQTFIVFENLSNLAMK